MLTFPYRVRLTAQAIRGGLGALFLGGWLSFNGEMGKGGLGRTALREVLPVECLEYEDLHESTEGFTAVIAAKKHPLARRMRLTNMPPVLGYNRVKPRRGCDVVATWKGSDDPAVAVGKFGKGRVLAYTSDPAPHWGCNLVFWERYNDFWLAALDWVTGVR